MYLIYIFFFSTRYKTLLAQISQLKDVLRYAQEVNRMTTVQTRTVSAIPKGIPYLLAINKAKEIHGETAMCVRKETEHAMNHNHRNSAR